MGELKVYCSECVHYVELHNMPSNDGLCGTTVEKGSAIFRNAIRGGIKASLKNAKNDCADFKGRPKAIQMLRNIFVP